MKFLKIILFVLLSIGTSVAELYVDNAKIDEDALVDSQKDSTVEATFKLPKVKRVPFAAIVVEGEITGDIKGTNPSLLISANKLPIASRTILNRKGKFSALFVITREIRNAVRQNKESLDVEISMIGKNQTACEIKKASLNVLVNEKHFRTSIYLRPIFSGDETIAESVFPIGNIDATKPAFGKRMDYPCKRR